MSFHDTDHNKYHPHMQKRHLDRSAYFNELANTSREFYIDYVSRFAPVGDGVKVLEIGCAEGGNLLPFAENGCTVTGIDLTDVRIEQAREFFESKGCSGTFMTLDFLEMESSPVLYDIILIHDVIEHVPNKEKFVEHIRKFLAPDGIIFWRFPAWQMPFGGHQQICHGRLTSHLPFMHLLPRGCYSTLLRTMGESQRCIDELTYIKECGTTIETFEKLLRANGYSVLDRCLWFINPHYQQKFGLKPRRLYPLLASTKGLRNFFATSCYYIVK